VRALLQPARTHAHPPFTPHHLEHNQQQPHARAPQQDDFLVGEEDEEEGGGGDGDADGKRRKRKRRKGPRDFRLDDEDYDLLEDNQVMVRRPAERTKRLKRKGGEDDRAMGAQQLKESLFGAGGAVGLGLGRLVRSGVLGVLGSVWCGVLWCVVVAGIYQRQRRR